MMVRFHLRAYTKLYSQHLYHPMLGGAEFVFLCGFLLSSTNFLLLMCLLSTFSLLTFSLLTLLGFIISFDLHNFIQAIIDTANNPDHIINSAVIYGKRSIPAAIITPTIDVVLAPHMITEYEIPKMVTKIGNRFIISRY